MNFYLSLISFTLMSLILPLAQSAVNDLTLVANSTGSDVVLAVTRKIYRSGIFEDDFFLGHRVALVASRFGEVPTLSPTTHRGIWQLTRDQFAETKNNPSLAGLRARVEETWSEEIGPWDLITWEQLDIPLHAGIAFRLFVETLTEQSIEDPFLPSLLLNQFQFYRDNVNPSVNSTQFVQQVAQFETAQLTKCSSESDIVFVQDGSCTVYPANFTDALNFFSGIVSFFTFNQLRVGHVVYSSDVVSNFGLDNGFITEDELREAMMNATRPPLQYTLTGAGLSAGLGMFVNSTPREGGVPRILISYTDGSAVDLLDEVTNKTMAAGIETFAVGTAFGWTNWQLEVVAHNKPGRVLRHGHTYSLSSEFMYRFNQEICSVPTSPSLGYEMSSGVVTEGERRYFLYKFRPTSATSVNVTISLMEGNVSSFYSWKEETPDRVVNDGEINVRLGEAISTFIDLPQDEEVHLNVGIAGLEMSANVARYMVVVDLITIEE